MGAGIRSRRLTRAIRRRAARGAGLVVALAILSGLARAGSSYFYCPFMDTIVAEHCCAHEDSEPAPAASAPDCCEVRTVGTLPSASAAAQRSDLPAAPLLAVVSPIVDVRLGASTPAPRSVTRSGLSPPQARRSAQKTVLRT